MEGMAVHTFKSTISFFADSSSFLLTSSAGSVDGASEFSEDFSDALSVLDACSVEYSLREQGTDTRCDEANMEYSCCRGRVLWTRAAKIDVEIGRVLLSCAWRATLRRDLRIVVRDVVLKEATVYEGDSLDFLWS